jgi:hypothetical protein
MHNVNAACQPVTDCIASGARRNTAELCSAEWRVIEVSLHTTRFDDVVARGRGEVGDLTEVKCKDGNPSDALLWREASLAS